MKEELVTHAGGIVYRSISGFVQYLLVGFKSGEVEEWLFPKGHIEPGESFEEAAIREVEEESGITSEIVSPVGNSTIFVNGTTLNIRYFLMKYLWENGEGEPRRAVWVPVNKATEMLTYADSKSMLISAEALRLTLNKR